MKQYVSGIMRLCCLFLTLTSVCYSLFATTEEYCPMITMALQHNSEITQEVIQTAQETLEQFLETEFPHEEFMIKIFRDELCVYLTIYKKVSSLENRTHVRSIYKQVSDALHILIARIKRMTQELLCNSQPLIVYPIYGSIDPAEMMPSF